jgi:hypothetical protein
MFESVRTRILTGSYYRIRISARDGGESGTELREV